MCLFGFQRALQGSPWGLMRALEQQVGELRLDDAEGCGGAPGEPGDTWPSSAASTAFLVLQEPAFVPLAPKKPPLYFKSSYNHLVELLQICPAHFSTPPSTVVLSRF